MIWQNICICFDVVQHRRLAENTFRCRERRTRTRLTPFSLDGIHQRCLLAADKGTGSETYTDIERKSRSENIIAQKTVFMSLIDSDIADALRPSDIPL